MCIPTCKHVWTFVPLTWLIQVNLFPVVWNLVDMNYLNLCKCNKQPAKLTFKFKRAYIYYMVVH